MSLNPQLLVILAHAPSADATARTIAAELATLGYQVDQDVAAPGVASRKARALRMAAAHRYVVLWSREAAKDPALRAAAKHARRTGKLAGVRLDSAAPPVGGATAISLPRGRAQAHAWRRLLEQNDMPNLAAEARARQPTSRLTGFVAMLLLGLVTAGAGYVTNTAFAAQVDSLAERAQALVQSIAG